MGNLIKFRKLSMGSGEPYTTFNFDQGSYATFAETVTPGTYRITPIKHFGGEWAWWALKSTQISGITPHFLIAKADHVYMVAGEWLACWASSADTDTWYQFDNITIGASDLEFYNDTPFPIGTIYVAAMPMYPFSRVERKVSEWSESALVDETPSTTDKIISLATARANGFSDGRIAPALPHYGLKVANATINTKNNSILAAGNHPNETPGNFQLEGAINWLLTTSVKQKFLLDWFDFYVYPSLNPQGKWGGYFRSNPEDPTKDHNRYWDAGGLEDIDAFLAAFLADTGNDIEVGFDYHAWYDQDGAKVLVGDSTTASWVAFLAKMSALVPGFVARADDTTVSMLHNVWANLPSPLAGGIDHGLINTKGVADWKSVGENSMIALANMLADGLFTQGPGVGSREFNGTTDRIDWATVTNPTGAAFSLSAWVWLDVNNANEYVLCVHDSGDAAFGLLVNFDASGKFGLLRHGTTDYRWYHATGPSIATGAWHHVLLTNDGGVLTGSTVLYVDGVSKTVSFTNGSGAETAHTGSWSLGGRIFDDTRNLNGKLAQIGIWNRVLTSGEIANLNTGYAPSLIATNLQFYFKGNTDDLSNEIGGADGTADGTTQLTGAGNGPGIIYP